MTSARVVISGGAAAVVFCAAATGCESTRDKAKHFSQQGSKAFDAKGLSIVKQSDQVQVVSRQVLSDANGTAAVLGLRNRSGRVLRNVPISIVVTNAAGAPLYRNNAAGLQRGLVSAPVLEPGKTAMWINDQVQPVGEGKPSAVKAKVGTAKAGSDVKLLDPGTPKLEGDPTSGIEAVGMLLNTTSKPQKGVTVSAVAVKGTKVVAAGRAIVQAAIQPGKKGRYSVFFIGDPRGARLQVVAPSSAP